MTSMWPAATKNRKHSGTRLTYTSGNTEQVKVHFKGKSEDFIIFVDSPEAVQNWKKDSSIPLAQVIDGWKIFVTHGYVPLYPSYPQSRLANNTHSQGSHGILDAASNQALEDEFGSSKEEDVVKQILEKGQVMETKGAERQGDRNLTEGDRVAH